MNTLLSYPALHRALCIFHGRAIRSDIEVPQIWTARFRIADQMIAALPNPQWFATVNKPADLQRMFATTGHIKIVSQCLFDWEPPQS